MPDEGLVREAASARPPRRRWKPALFLAPVLALALVAYFVQLPYYVISPGAARDVLPLIQVRERQTYPSSGSLLLTAVNVGQANLYEVLEAWIDPADAVVPEHYVVSPGHTQEDEARIARSEMDTSKIDAAYVALSELTAYPRRHGPGALVERVAEDTPAEGKLFAGDLIVEVDGEIIHDPGDVGSQIRAAGEGQPLAFTVRARGKTRRVSIAAAEVPGQPNPIVGVSLVPNFPFPVTIRSGEIGGPSAGLMWTLGLIDALTPEDLTRGKRIAGTGQITLSGDVLPIGAVEEKVLAAERAGSDVFFVPESEAGTARTAASAMEVIPVRTYAEALRYLRGLS